MVTPPFRAGSEYVKTGRLKDGTRLKGMTRLKGELYGNPALQGGGRVRQDRSSEGRHPPERRHLGIVLMTRPWDAGKEDIQS